MILLFAQNSIAQMITTYAGDGTEAVTVPGPLDANTSFQFVDALAFDPSGNLYVCTYENKVFQITPGGMVNLFAGTGSFPASGDGGLAVNAGIGRIVRIIFDPAGNAYLASAGTHRVRKVNTAGIISTVAGTGAMGYNGDGILATTAQLAYPSGLAMDAAGNLYITDGQSFAAQNGNRIRKIDMGTGMISTIAGTGVGGDTGNGGLATAAQIATYAITIDPSDNLFLQNVNGSGIRKINLGTGIISNFAGTGTSGYSGDGGPALLAEFGDIMDIKSDASGNIYLTEWVTNNVVRKINTSGIVSTVAGNGTPGFSGDGSSPLFAQLYHPHAVAISSSNNEIFIADELNYRIRKLDLLATPVCPNTLTVTKTYLANGEVLITPTINPNVGSPNYTGTINGNPVLNPMPTSIINTTTTHTEFFPGNGIYSLSLTYLDTISSIVCLRTSSDTISITNSTTPRSFNRHFSLSDTYFCNSGSLHFVDTTSFQYSLANPSALYTVVTNWGNGTTTTENYTGTDQINITSAPVTYIAPGTYTIQSVLSGGGVENDTTIAFLNVFQCGDLSGTLFNDIDNNCSQDIWAGEFPITNNVPVKASNGTNTYFTWSIGGSYSFSNIVAGTYTIEVLTGSTGYVITCANSLPHSTTVVAGNTTTENFALNCSGGFDIATTGISLFNGFFPGQTDMILPHVGILNGTCDFVVPGQVKMILTPCIQYVPGGSSAVPPSLIIPAATGDTLVWNVSDLNTIGNFGYWNYAVNVSTCTTAVVGDTACITMMVLPFNGDSDISNNTFTQCFVIGVSYDPNNKEVSPSGIGAAGIIPASTSELTYTINFQNTGTAPAVNIYLLDTISANLDLYSIKILNSSHYMQPYLLTDRTMKFMFPNINLADSVSNEPLSHGYVTYKIALNPALAPGTEIENTAGIYFDYNDPVMTNTALNTIETVNSVNEEVMNNFIVYPNPANNIVTVSSGSTSEYSLSLLDVFGKEIRTINTVQGKIEMDVNELPAGIYFFVMTQNNESTIKKLIVTK